MPLIAYVNGEFIALEDAKIHIEDRGFQFADGVYEVIACYHGVYLDLEPHLQRLERSCSAIGLKLPCPLDEMQSLVKQCYEKNPFEDAMIYIQVTRGVAARSHVVKKSLTPTLIITSRKLPQPSDKQLEQGAKIITLQDIRWKRCDIKSIALLASVMGKQEAVSQGADEAFWLDEKGHVLEGCSTNAFAVINNRIVTHPLDQQVLGGITRSMALRLAKENAINVEERAWSLNEKGLTECMMSSTTNAVFPVCQINDVIIGNGRPGPVCQRLRKLILDELASLKV